MNKIAELFKSIDKEVFLFSLASLLLLHSIYFLFFFLIPLQLLRNKKGVLAAIQASVIVLAAVLVISFFRTFGIAFTQRAIIIFSNFVIPVFLLAGFLYINYNWSNNPRMLKKVFIITAIMTAASIPVFVVLSSESFYNFFKQQVSIAFELIKAAANDIGSADADDFGSVIKTLDSETVFALMEKMLLRVYVFFYFIMLAGSWWFVNFFSRGSLNKSRLAPSSFMLPQVMVWPLIAALLVVVVDYKFSAGVLGYAGWNILLIMLALYGFRVIGIIQIIMTKANMPRFLRSVVFFMITLLLLRSGLNFFVLIAIPALGVSEIWINYNKRIEE